MTTSAATAHFENTPHPEATPRPDPTPQCGTTLHIEHPITSYQVWKAAFDRFAGLRSSSGVRSYTIRRAVGDDQYIAIDLSFEEAAAAAAFLDVLRQRVWATPETSPGLAGAPCAHVLTVAERG